MTTFRCNITSAGGFRGTIRATARATSSVAAGFFAIRVGAKDASDAFASVYIWPRIEQLLPRCVGSLDAPHLCATSIRG